MNFPSSRMTATATLITGFSHIIIGSPCYFGIADFTEKRIQIQLLTNLVNIVNVAMHPNLFILAMKIQANTLCPCGSGKRFKFCCAQNTLLPESIERYEILSEILGQTIELGSSLLDTEEFREFCNNSVDQFRLLLDYDQHKFEEMLNSNIGCQLLMEWLIFLAPLALPMDELENDLKKADKNMN